MKPSALKILKRLAVAVFGIVILIFVLGLMGFELSKYPPERPTNIPDDTVWAGGVDGGAWIKCVEIPSSDPQTFTCDVFGENGSTWLSKGNFQAFKVSRDRNSNSALFEEARLTELHYNGYDGRTIHLRNGYALKLSKSK
ncbi:MAG: hypothetical protein QUS14_17555 [Pyrinomonadaceae bacterium]|nr:hypothetical protein [Pyrinomonadaceae bacterium]